VVLNLPQGGLVILAAVAGEASTWRLAAFASDTTDKQRRGIIKHGMEQWLAKES